jgi:hypothetical protein
LNLVEDQSILSAANLSWEAEPKRFTCPPEEIVILKRGDGTRIEGKGLILSTLERSIEFTGACNGTLVSQ